MLVVYLLRAVLMVRLLVVMTLVMYGLLMNGRRQTKSHGTVTLFADCTPLRRALTREEEDTMDCPILLMTSTERSAKRKHVTVHQGRPLSVPAQKMMTQVFAANKVKLISHKYVRNVRRRYLPEGVQAWNGPPISSPHTGRSCHLLILYLKRMCHPGPLETSMLKLRRNFLTLKRRSTNRSVECRAGGFPYRYPHLQTLIDH